MTSTVAASQVRVHQHGNAVIGERVDLVYDEKTGVVAEKTTTVAQVPTRDGGTAILVGEQIRAAQVTPNYSARRAIQYTDYDEPSPPSKKEQTSALGCFWMVCGCFIFVVSLAIMITVGAAGLLACQPLEGAGVSGIILGVVALLMSCVCCACICNQSSFLSQCVFCLVISLLLLLFIVTLIPNTVFVAQNMDLNSTSSNTNVTDLCHAPIISVALSVMGVSYGLLVFFVFFCFCATCGCLIQLGKPECVEVNGIDSV